MIAGESQRRNGNPSRNAEIPLHADEEMSARRALTPSELRSAETASEVERTLQERARQYARALSQVEVGPRAEVLLFRVREEQYAAESRLLRAVHRAKGLTPVPCTPPHVAGILNVRGEVVTVLDLAVALDLSGSPELSDSAQVLLVELPQVRVGLLIDEVLGVRQLSLDGLDRALSGRDFARGVAEARIVFLDLEQLLSGGRFDVLDDVS